MKFLDFHTHELSNKKENIDILVLKDGEPMPKENVLFGIGLHPWDSFEQNKFELKKETAKDKNLIYIGECGLDKIKGADLSIQTEIFKQHIVASEKWEKPLLIHCVGCFNELLMLYKEYTPKQKWIVHGYRGSPQLAKQLIDAGFLLSFGTAILRKESKAAQSMIVTPKEKLLLETDDATNSIHEVYKAAAELIQIGVEELKSTIFDNFMRISPNNYNTEDG